MNSMMENDGSIEWTGCMAGVDDDDTQAAVYGGISPVHNAITYADGGLSVWDCIGGWKSHIYCSGGPRLPLWLD